MKISKEYIMALSALIAVLGLVAGGYQFYYKERLDTYQKNIQEQKKLEDTLAKLETAFNSTRPDKLIAAIKGEMNPLEAELQKRATFFTTKDLMQIEPIPEGKMLSFYYREEFDRLFSNFRQDALRRFPTCYYPDITFGAPRPDEWTGIAVTKSEVEFALKKLTFGLAMTRMLMEAKAIYITDIQVWPPRRMGMEDIFTARIVGFSFAIMPKDLVAFLDKLRTGDRYVTVNGISIQNKYLRWPVEPPLEVQMLVTFLQANLDGAPIEGEQVAVAAGAAGGAIGGTQSAEDALAAWKNRLKAGGEGGIRDRDPRGRNIPTTKWGRFKRWMGKYFWPF